MNNLSLEQNINKLIESIQLTCKECDFKCHISDEECNVYNILHIVRHTGEIIGLYGLLIHTGEDTVFWVMHNIVIILVLESILSMLIMMLSLFNFKMFFKYSMILSIMYLPGKGGYDMRLIYISFNILKWRWTVN